MVIKKITHIKNMEELVKEHKNEKIIVVNFQENNFTTIKKVVEECNKEGLGVEVGRDFFIYSKN